jgi:hypothetical protein
MHPNLFQSVFGAANFFAMLTSFLRICSPVAATGKPVAGLLLYFEIYTSPALELDRLTSLVVKIL